MKLIGHSLEGKVKVAQVTDTILCELLKSNSSINNISE